MKILLEDLDYNATVFPFAEIESIARCRVGILTLFEKWNYVFPEHVFIQSEIDPTAYNENFIRIPANLIPSFEMMQQVKKDGFWNMQSVSRTILYPWDFFLLNDWALRQDFEMLTKGKISRSLPSDNHYRNTDNIFLEDNVQIHFSVINADEGPVYIGKNVEIMEGSLLRGPLAILENSVIKMGAKIYGATTIGPHSVAGGEIKNSILMGFSNKSHDGYLGDSVIGKWCNWGAGTSNSNLKNTASPVMVWSNSENAFLNAGYKCGLLMGDYSRSAINTTFNTGSVVGVCCHIFGNTPSGKLSKNFTWGNGKYELDKVFSDIDNWKKLKGKNITEKEKSILEKLYHQK